MERLPAGATGMAAEAAATEPTTTPEMTEAAAAKGEHMSASALFLGQLRTARTYFLRFVYHCRWRLCLHVCMSAPYAAAGVRMLRAGGDKESDGAAGSTEFKAPPVAKRREVGCTYRPRHAFSIFHLSVSSIAVSI